MKQNELFSYTYDFISQLIENKSIIEKVEKIILFGSIARGDFHEKSDIDLFMEVKDLKDELKIKEITKKELNKFEQRAEKTWHLRNLDVPIKIIIGKLNQDKYNDLKQEILTYAKILYSNYEENPENLNHNLLITYDLKTLLQKDKMALLRKLYGYKLKKPKKEYVQKGLIHETNSEKINSNTLIIKKQDLLKIKQLFKKYKIPFQLRDIWTK